MSICPISSARHASSSTASGSTFFQGPRLVYACLRGVEKGLCRERKRARPQMVPERIRLFEGQPQSRLETSGRDQQHLRKDIIGRKDSKRSFSSTSLGTFLLWLATGLGCCLFSRRRVSCSDSKCLANLMVLTKIKIGNRNQIEIGREKMRKTLPASTSIDQ